MYEDFADLNYNANPVWTVNSGIFTSTNSYLESLSAASSVILTSSTKDNGDFGFDIMPGRSDWYIVFMGLRIGSFGGASPDYTGYSLQIRDVSETSKILQILRDNTYVIGLNIPISSTTFTNVNVNRTPSGVFTLTIGTNTASATDTTYSSSSYVAIYQRFGAVRSKVDNISWVYKSTGVYTSSISTYSSLSAWRSFDADETLNGQTINYFVRTATSSYNTGLATWESITSGSVISTVTANKYFQWKAELSTNDTSKTPLVDAVTANYREGDATSTRLQAINYKNRYLLTGSTTAANNYNDIVLVKTRTPLDNWMVYDWQVSSLSKWNTYLYGGISQSANVARFDYGSNDNGAAINAYWTWGDQHWDRLSYKKNLKEIYGFYIPTRSSANTYIGYSYDGGSTWTNKTVDMTGSTYFGTKKLLINGGVGNAFRFRIGNSSLDQSFNVLGIDVWALPYAYRE